MDINQMPRQPAFWPAELDGPGEANISGVARNRIPRMMLIENGVISRASASYVAKAPNLNAFSS